MKTKFLLIAAFVSLTFNLFAQDFSDYDDVVLKDPKDYVANEDKALECADYILSVKINNPKDKNRDYAMRFLIRWMEGAEYSFVMNSKPLKMAKSEPLVLVVYMASMTKYVLEHKEDADNEKEVEYNAVLLTLKYCEKPSNGVKLDKNIKKLIELRDEKKLKEYLK